jgi:hypothetical protein
MNVRLAGRMQSCQAMMSRRIQVKSRGETEAMRSVDGKHGVARLRLTCHFPWDETCFSLELTRSQAIDNPAVTGMTSAPIQIGTAAAGRSVWLSAR